MLLLSAIISFVLGFVLGFVPILVLVGTPEQCVSPSSVPPRPEQDYLADRWWMADTMPLPVVYRVGHPVTCDRIPRRLMLPSKW